MKQLWLLALVFGCSAGDDATIAMCAQRAGTYRVTYVERSGACGAFPEQLMTIDEQPTTAPPPCFSGEIRYSSNNCEVTNVDVHCPEPGSGEGHTSMTNGKYTWNESGSRGEGTMQIVLRDAESRILCQSTYNVIAVRL
jgi:hypothetical protein